MKFISRLLVVVFVFLAFSMNCYAQSQNEELQQMVEQLQKTPGDTALREKIIMLAPTVIPSPDLPDTAINFEGRAQFAFKSAKSEDDFLAAAHEYEKAIAVAPWVLGYYADLCTIYENAGKFEDAKRNCVFYRIGLTDPAQITDIKRRIAGLEFGIENANSPEARAAKEKEAEQRFIASLEGAKYICPEFRNNDDAHRVEIEIRNGKIDGDNVITWINPRLTPGVNYASNAYVGFKGMWWGGNERDGMPIQGKVSVKNTGSERMRVELYENRLVFEQQITYAGSGTPEVFPAQTCSRVR